MAVLALDPGESASSTVTSSSQVIDLAMTSAVPPHGFYSFVSSTNCYLAQGDDTPTATSANMLVPAGVPILVDSRAGDHVAVLRVSADGVCSLTRAVLAW
jgi:hypothetical protein